ncbi:unnamed protein product [Cylicostephanus goldi]|uniref:Uncharacterized protein n=1 Tax=Cylicostephanus goldi TaxID=71465 RepID=A0A3P6SEF8_CYLGO|nr:unnamed protein product [Cylicostephanus goldi]
MPRKRVNPAFDKAKEKFASGAAAGSGFKMDMNPPKESVRRSASPSVNLMKEKLESEETTKVVRDYLSRCL